MDIRQKQLVVFDLDGTLAPSKNAMESSMKILLQKLLEFRSVAIIGGGKFELFQAQLLSQINYPTELLKKLHLFPNTASRMYEYESGEWQQIYGDTFTDEEVSKIINAFKKAFEEIRYVHPETLYGEEIENRGTQVSFSVFGQEAPLDLKEKYRGSEQDRRLELKTVLDKYLPEFEVRVAGHTTIDVTRKGIDKAYGLHQIEQRLGIKITDMVFVGDALFPGGNDEAVKKTGVDTVEVRDPQHTEQVISQWLTELL